MEKHRQISAFTCKGLLYFAFLICAHLTSHFYLAYCKTHCNVNSAIQTWMKLIKKNLVATASIITTRFWQLIYQPTCKLYHSVLKSQSQST